MSGQSVEAVHTGTLIHCHTVTSLPHGLCFVTVSSSVDIDLPHNMLATCMHEWIHACDPPIYKVASVAYPAAECMTVHT